MKKIDEKGVIALSLSSLDESVHLRPETTPAKVLGQYLQSLSQLLLGNGIESEDILFESITEGCTQIAVHTTPAKQNQLIQNIMNVSDEGYSKFRKQLTKDNYRANIVAKIDDNNTFSKNLLPESSEEAFFEYEVIQEEAFRGKLVAIGGKDETVPLRLQTDDGETISLTTDSQELAKKMAHHLFEYLECIGSGVLKLGQDLTWKPVSGKFKIHEFFILPDVNYDEWLSKLRSIESDWSTTDNPIQKIQEIREGE